MSRGFVVWLTGLSGAGKSTIAELLQAELEQRGRENLSAIAATHAAAHRES